MFHSLSSQQRTQESLLILLSAGVQRANRAVYERNQQQHSVVAALMEAGIIEPDEIYAHPQRNQIYRSLGQKTTIEVDTATLQLAAGDILLVCSDGLWKMVREQQIAAILTTPMPTPIDTVQTLIQAALAGGGTDNVSAIVAQVSKVS